MTVPYGGGQSYTIAAQSGYHIQDVAVDGESVGAVSSYAFNQVSADHTITASFALNNHTITSAAGAHGTIAPVGSRTVSHGGNQTYSITADPGYYVSDVVVDGQSVGAVSTYTFSTVVADHTIVANFAMDTHTITASAGQGGTISPSGQISVSSGNDQTFTIQASMGYAIQDVRVDSVSVGIPNSYTFENVNGSHTIEAFFVGTNQAPVADAGPDQAVDEAQQVVLSGLNSMDPDDGIATFEWRQIQGPGVVLNTPLDAEATFVAPEVGVGGQALVFELLVTDNSGQTAADTCIVNVSWVNAPPIAQAGADQTVSTGQEVSLTAANSVDLDDGIAGYHWVQVQGPSAMLSDEYSPQPYFTAPDVGPQGTSMTFELTVTDNSGLQDTDRCIVTVGWVNMQPVADAGPDQQVLEGDELYLDGSNSKDGDDGIASYRWQQTDGLPVILSDATAVSPSLIAPKVGPQGAALTFQLTVTDNSGLQHQDACVVNVLWENEPPTASAGPDQTVGEGSLVHLDGTASYDPDDGIAVFQWAQLEGPTVELSDSLSEQPSLTAPDVGPQGAALTFELTVSDHGGLKSQNTCVVNVTWQNSPPLADAGPDQAVTAESLVTLDGSSSTDDDDGIVSYRWKQIAGAPVVLLDPAEAVTTFTAPSGGSEGMELIFELAVTDNGGLKSVDSCEVVLNPDSDPLPDTTPPEVKITDPSAEFMFVRRSKISLAGTAWDDFQVERVVWESSRGGSGEAEGTAQWTITDLQLRRWFNQITITAYDTAGNQHSATIWVFAIIRR